MSDETPTAHPCSLLDLFFDNELPPAEADAFRAHVGSCKRCERVLHGRMQEHVLTRSTK